MQTHEASMTKCGRETSTVNRDYIQATGQPYLSIFLPSTIHQLPLVHITRVVYTRPKALVFRAAFISNWDYITVNTVLWVWQKGKTAKVSLPQTILKNQRPWKNET